MEVAMGGRMLAWLLPLMPSLIAASLFVATLRLRGSKTL
jgi:hypothetical protein